MDTCVETDEALLLAMGEDSGGRISRPGGLVVLPGGNLHDFRVLAEGAVLAVVSPGLSAEA